MIWLDNNDPDWADDCFTRSGNGCRNWVACHELGHTVGGIGQIRSAINGNGEPSISPHLHPWLRPPYARLLGPSASSDTCDGYDRITELWPPFSHASNVRYSCSAGTIWCRDLTNPWRTCDNFTTTDFLPGCCTDSRC